MFYDIFITKYWYIYQSFGTKNCHLATLLENVSQAGSHWNVDERVIKEMHPSEKKRYLATKANVSGMTIIFPNLTALSSKGLYEFFLCTKGREILDFQMWYTRFIWHIIKNKICTLKCFARLVKSCSKLIINIEKFLIKRQIKNKIHILYVICILS